MGQLILSMGLVQRKFASLHRGLPPQVRDFLILITPHVLINPDDDRGWGCFQRRLGTYWSNHMRKPTAEAALAIEAKFAKFARLLG
jgi:hypothetical protein